MNYKKESFEINLISAIAVGFALLISLFAWL
jgi:hypothetical protein